MIYQLIKRQLPWKFAIVLSVIFAAASLIAPGVAVVSCTLGFLLLLAPGFMRRCTLYEAALPINGRYLICSRIFTDVLAMLLFYLPLISRFVTERNTHKEAIAVVFSEIAAIFILAIVTIQSADVRAFSPPRWWRISVWTLFATALIGIAVPTMQADFPSAPRNLAILVFAMCALGSVALFTRILARAPESLQSAPQSAASREDRAKQSWLPSLSWASPLRSVGASAAWLFLFCVLMANAGARPWFVMIFFCLTLTWAIQALRDSSWLFALPLSGPQMFLLMFGPGLLGLGVGAALSPLIKPKPTTVMLLDLALVAITFFLAIASIQWVIDRQRFPWRLRLVLFLMLSLCGLSLVLLILGHNPMRISLAGELAEYFPNHIAPLIATALLVSAGLCWRAYRVLSRLEVRALPINRYAKRAR